MFWVSYSSSFFATKRLHSAKGAARKPTAQFAFALVAVHPHHGTDARSNANHLSMYIHVASNDV